MISGIILQLGVLGSLGKAVVALRLEVGVLGRSQRAWNKSAASGINVAVCFVFTAWQPEFAPLGMSSNQILVEW